MLCVSRRNLCRAVHVWVWVIVGVCSYPYSFDYLLSPLAILPFHCPRCFCILQRICCTFYNSNRNCHPFPQFVVLESRECTPFPPLPRNSFLTLPTFSQASHEPIWASSSLVTHTHAYTHIICHISLFLPFSIWNCCCCPFDSPPPFVLPRSIDNIQLNVCIAAVAK